MKKPEWHCVEFGLKPPQWFLTAGDFIIRSGMADRNRGATLKGFTNLSAMMQTMRLRAALPNRMVRNTSNIGVTIYAPSDSTHIATFYFKDPEDAALVYLKFS